MTTTTRQPRRAETPRSIALSRHRSPSRWITDAFRRIGIDAPWPRLAVGAAALAALLLL